MAVDDSSDDPVSRAIESLHQARANPELVEVPEFKFTDRNEYEQCVAPLNALSHFAVKLELAITQIQRELSVLRAIGVAEHAVWSRKGKIDEGNYLLIPLWVWPHGMRLEDDFWQTGYLYSSWPTEQPGFSYDKDSWIKLFKVRFWLRDLSEQALASPDESEAEKLPTVSKGDLEKWHTIFAEVHPNSTEAFALRSAAALFPDNHIPRQWVRDLRGPQKRGKPVKRHQ